MNICQTEKKQLEIIAEKEATAIAGRQKIDEKQLQKQKQRRKPLQDSKNNIWETATEIEPEAEAIVGQQKIDEKQLQK